MDLDIRTTRERQALTWIAAQLAKASAPPIASEVAAAIEIPKPSSINLLQNMVARGVLLAAEPRKIEGHAPARAYTLDRAVVAQLLPEISEQRERKDNEVTTAPSRNVYQVLGLLRRSHKLVQALAPISAAAAELDRDMKAYLGQRT